jgi:hypothetical protein
MSLPRVYRVLPLVIAIAGVAVFSSHTAAPAEIDGYCWHDQWVISSEWHCPGDTTKASAAPLTFLAMASRPAPAGPDSLVVYVKGKGSQFALPANYDAVLLSRFAVDTFLIRSLEANGRPNAAKAARLFLATHWPARPDKMWVACVSLIPPATFECNSAASFDPKSVDSVRVVRFRAPGRGTLAGAKYELAPGPGVDGIFITRRAAQQMLLPYYRGKVNGKAKADLLDAAIARRRWR